MQEKSTAYRVVWHHHAGFGGAASFETLKRAESLFRHIRHDADRECVECVEILDAKGNSLAFWESDIDPFDI